MKVLVLDFGTHSIKALYFEKKYSGYKLLNFSNTLLSRDAKLSNSERIIDAVKTMMAENKYEPDQTAVIYPAEKTTSRFIILPFRDNKRISVALPLELEEQLPFDIEQVLYEWQIVEYLGKGSRIFVTVTKKDDFEDFMQLMTACGIEPDVVTTGTDTLFNLANFLKLGKEIVDVEEAGGAQKKVQVCPVVIIDMGCTKTNIVLSRDGVPEYSRLINYGGDHITKKIMEYYELNYDDAEKSKVDVGYIIVEGDTAEYTKEQLNYSSVLKEAYDIIIRDINQTLASYKTEKKDHISKCFLAGAGWQTRNFKEYITQELKLDISPLEFHQSMGIKLPFSGTPDELRFCNTVGFFLRYAGKATLKGMNFKRKVSGVAPGSMTEFAKLFKPTIRNISIALCFLIIYLVSHSMLLSRAQSQYAKEVEIKLKEAFPDKDKKMQRALLENHAKLKKEVQSRLKLQKALLESGGTKAGSSLAVLKELSEAISTTDKVDVVELVIEGPVLKSMKMLVTDQSAGERIVSGMELRKFKNAKQVVKVELNTNVR